jgi:hypothetical protein
LRGHPADRKLDELEADLTRELMARLGNN